MKRVKKVFSNASDVIHLFCQRTQGEARSSNCYFECDEIYSYEIDRVNDTINNKSMIRLSPCGEFVETSQAIRIPKREALLLFHKIEKKEDIKGYDILGNKLKAL